MSWVDGYECYGIQDIQKIAGSSEPDHPLLILLAHDGDNAFGGGYSYYEQCVKQFVDQAEEEVLTYYTTKLVVNVCYRSIGIHSKYNPAVLESVPSR